MLENTMPFVSLSQIPIRENIIHGFNVQFVHTDNLTFAFWAIEEGAILPEHSHPHEQVANVLEGRFELTIEGVSSILTPGSIGIIPANARHSGRALSPCRVLDVFYPIREDYR
jgi:quercetin dioxygenase-like cupin family protein